MTVPTATDLITERFLRPPTTARGVYLDRRPSHDDVHMRLVWAAPNKWVWMHTAEPAAGAITNGMTNIIIEEGAAVVITDEGEVGTTHRLRNLLRPRGYDFEGWELGPVSAGTAVGRSAWFFSVTPTMPGKAAHEVAFDAESGVILFMRSDEYYLGFEVLQLDEVIPDETFQWDGPVEPRKVGQALVIPEEDGTFLRHLGFRSWSIDVRSPGTYQDHEG